LVRFLFTLGGVKKIPYSLKTKGTFTPHSMLVSGLHEVLVVVYFLPELGGEGDLGLHEVLVVVHFLPELGGEGDLWPP